MFANIQKYWQGIADFGNSDNGGDFSFAHPATLEIAMDTF